MSKSKRAAQGVIPPAPDKKKRLFTGDDGTLRTGWLLAVSLLCCVAAALAARLGLVRAFAALFAAWGIDADNAWRAPAWARAVYAWHGSLATAVYAAALLAVSLWLRGLWGLPKGATRFGGRALFRGALVGLGGAVAVALLCLIPDSVRPEWPLTAPRLSLALPALLIVSLLVALAEEAFTKTVLYDGLLARRGGAWASAAACAAFFLMNGGYAAGVVGGANVLLLGLLGCLVYAGYGLWAAVGLRWGWSAANVLLLGFGGGDYAVYRLYAVSDRPMTGGDYGPVYGLWTTLLLAGGIAWMATRKRKQNQSDRYL